MNKLLDLLKSYGFSLFYILLFEMAYILLGYKGNSVSIRKNKHSTDTIPCPYFFLSKIHKTLQEKQINLFVDLGCGNGRVIYFFRKKFKTRYLGVELFNEPYVQSYKLFENINEVEIIKKNLFEIDYKSINADCYFINDPLKDRKIHDNLIKTLISGHNSKKGELIFILINLSLDKLEIFKKMKLIDSFKINDRGYYIYVHNNIN